jgi:hypothetical protein
MIYTPRCVIGMLEHPMFRTVTNKQVCTKINFRGFEISIAMDSSHGPGDLTRSDIRVFDQDRGVELVNHKTGTRTRWAVGRTMQRDGEVLGWCLFPTPETVRQSPAVEHYCMTLIND